MVEIESPESLQATVIDFYGDSKAYEEKADEEKNLIFGSMCWKYPKIFKFLPRKKASIKSIKSLCQQLKEKQPLMYNSPNLDAPARVQLKATKAASTTTVNHDNNDRREETVDKTGRTIEFHMEWRAGAIEKKEKSILVLRIMKWSSSATRELDTVWALTVTGERNSLLTF